MESIGIQSVHENYMTASLKKHTLCFSWLRKTSCYKKFTEPYYVTRLEKSVHSLDSKAYLAVVAALCVHTS